LALPSRNAVSTCWRSDDNTSARERVVPPRLVDRTFDKTGLPRWTSIRRTPFRHAQPRQRSIAVRALQPCRRASAASSCARDGLGHAQKSSRTRRMAYGPECSCQVVHGPDNRLPGLVVHGPGFAIAP
jgi:hypothetical protein